MGLLCGVKAELMHGNTPVSTLRWSAIVKNSNSSTNTTTNPPVDLYGAMRPADFCRRYGIGRTALYAEIGSGRLVAMKRGRCTLISVQAAEQWLKGLDAISARAA